MEQKLFELAASQGIWAVLSIGLIFYVIKAQEKRDIRQEEREKSYQQIIYNLTDELGVIHGMKETLDNIEKFIK